MRVFFEGAIAQELAREAQRDAVYRSVVVAIWRGGRPPRDGSLVHKAFEHDGFDPQRARNVSKTVEGVPRGASRSDPGQALVAQVASANREEF